MTKHKAVGARLRQLRENYQARAKAQDNRTALSLSQLARKLYGRQATVKGMDAYETGTATLSKEQVGQISSFYGVPSDWLAKGTAKFAHNDIIRLPGVAGRITTARTEKGLTQRGLSVKAALGETTKNISRLEDYSHSPRLGTIQKISQALDVPETWLLYGKKR